MEEEGIGLVLAKASELRLKISNYIHKASLSPDKQRKRGGEGEGEREALLVNGDKKNGSFKSEGEGEEEENYDEEAERLLNIHDALESLEVQLGNLQNLQQQQRYDREVALSEIEYSRKMLLEKLKQYKGEELEVIQEASAFAGETVDHNNDLILPPYPSRPPHSHILDNNNGGYSSPFHYTRKSLQNGANTNDSANAKKNMNETEGGSRKGIGHFICSVAKTVLPVVGLVYVLSMSGFGRNVVKVNRPLKFLGIVKEQQSDEEKRPGDVCPPGKIIVVENGEARCLVKERVEIPFGLVAAKPDINYGSG